MPFFKTGIKAVAMKSNAVNLKDEGQELFKNKFRLTAVSYFEDTTDGETHAAVVFMTDITGDAVYGTSSKQIISTMLALAEDYASFEDFDAEGCSFMLEKCKNGKNDYYRMHVYERE